LGCNPFQREDGGRAKASEGDALEERSLL
jgi:hypothetical protein